MNQIDGRVGTIARWQTTYKAFRAAGEPKCVFLPKFYKDHKAAYVSDARIG